MNKLKKKLQDKKSQLLNIYCTAGFPNLHDLPKIANTLYESGADMIEVGIPYSDPIADGPTIQASNSVALENGITMDLIFDQVNKFKEDMPKILMGYLNPVLQYGFEKFVLKCSEARVDGVILPDLPLEVYEEQYKLLFEEYGISFIFLITPDTSPERIARIDELSSTFIYAVSSSSTTGKGDGIKSAVPYLSKIRKLSLKHPVLVGFNISTPSDLELVHTYAPGGIIGSAFIKSLVGHNDVESASKQFVEKMTKINTMS
ncbi:tryptophan synthase subunit alpha [Cryomorphaceae bacterium]|nr:tryptophan synthase subunit alpha [Cryomorphaceae bacterium]